MTQNPRVPYLEYVAKNVGIRRATAPFVLVTNADILLGREVVDAIADRRLQPGTMYRAPRYDIKLGVDQSRPALAGARGSREPGAPAGLEAAALRRAPRAIFC